VALWLVLNYEIAALSACKLRGAGLLGIKMVETRLSGKYFSVLGNL
jgi:hypothetical protein